MRLEEKRPTSPEWTKVRNWTSPNTIVGSVWRRGPVLAISELANAELPDGSGIGPQWLVSISRKGKRPKPADIRRTLRAFGMVGAEEDNHHPGNARSFWMPVDPHHRVDCECKTDETVHVEPDGYRWSSPVDRCTGCEYAATFGRPCPIHGAEARP